MQSLMPNDRTRVLIVRQCGDGGPQSEVPFPALSSDFDVVATDSIAKALNELERHEFHVALLVCANGRKHADSVHRVRGLYPRLPLVAVVSHETLDEVRAGLVDDAQDFLVADGMSPAAVEWTIHNAVRRTNRMLDLEQLAREIDHVDDGIRWARRKIRRQHRLAEKLATCIGHDFRASLTVVREHASLVTDGLCGPVTDDQAELLQTACDRVDDLCGMLHDVEYFGKLCAGGCRSRHRVCRVRDIVRSAMGKLAARAAASGQACTSEYDESASMIFCDPEMAAHLLLTLGVRAIQSVSAGGQVRIWAREDRVLRQVRLGICGNEALADGIEGEGSSFDGPASNGSKSTESRSFCLGTIVARELAARNLGRLREQWSARGGMRLWFDVPLAVPGEVIDRYLTRLRSLPGQPGEVCLLRARLDSDGGADRRQQIDRQLNVLLRPNDLLLRTGRADWLILIPPPRDFGRRMDRLANSVNSARYMNGRSTLAIVQAGTWSIERCASDLVAEMEIDELYSVGPTALTNQRVQDLSECTA